MNKFLFAVFLLVTIFFLGCLVKENPPTAVNKSEIEIIKNFVDKSLEIENNSSQEEKLNLCGNKIVDVNENCSNCIQDVLCSENQECVNGICKLKGLCGFQVCKEDEKCIEEEFCMNKSLCKDGTPINSCSNFKQKYCNENNELINDCKKCGCGNLSECQEDGSCKKKVFEQSKYECITCNGFCFSKNLGNELCIDNHFYNNYSYTRSNNCSTNSDCGPGFQCINNVCTQYYWENPYNVPIKIIPKYSESIPLNTEFNIAITILNNDNNSKKITLNKAIFFRYSNEGGSEDSIEKQINETKNVEGNSSEIFNFSFNSGNKESMTANLVFTLEIPHPIYGKAVIHLEIFPLIVYDKQNEASCGNKKYNKNMGVCFNEILYPTRSACYSNDDCLSEDYVCIENSCFSQISRFSPNQEYKVGALPILIVDNENLFNEMKDLNIAEFNNIINKSNKWFENERIYWNASNENKFTIKYEALDYCRLTKSEYLQLIKKHDSDLNFVKGLIEFCNVNKSEYSIVAVHEFWDEKLLTQDIFDERNRIGAIGAAGINYGDIIIFALDYSALIHETLHSFGEIDLYQKNGVHGSRFQWRNCNLFQANWMEFELNPHLCPLEAKIIGWKD